MLTVLWHGAGAAFLGHCTPSPLYLGLCCLGDPEMAVTTEIALKVCEPQRGVPSGWFADTQDRAATVESRSW